MIKFHIQSLVGLTMLNGHCSNALRWAVAWVGGFQSPRAPQTSTTPAVAALAASALAVGVMTSIQAWAGDYQQSYSVVRDNKGQRTGTIQCDGITSQCVTYDTKGRRTGTIDDAAPSTDQGRDLTAKEIIDQEHKDEGLGR